MAHKDKEPTRPPPTPPVQRRDDPRRGRGFTQPTFDFSGVRGYVGSIAEQLRGQVKIGESATGIKASQREMDFILSQGYSPPPDNFNSVPNIDKLSRFERRVMDWLPGFAEGDVGKALAKLSESPLGKLLSYLDVGAEGLERLIGFGTQFLTAIGTDDWNNFRQHTSEAWYAGSLAADMANLPVVRDGSVLFPTELPGESGLTMARKSIIELVSQGMDTGEALVQVRNEYYNSMGALAIRAQLHDAFFHLAADPINIVMPYLKPVERLKVGTLARVTTGAVPEDVARITTELGELLVAERKAGAAAERIAEIERAITWVNKADLLSPSQQKLLKLMGELPLEGDSRIAGFLRSKWNPFGLTPNARAMDFQNMVTDQVLTRIIGSLDDPEDIIRAIQRVKDGTVGQEFGHMIVSVQGRQVRSVVQAIDAEAASSLNVWRETSAQRNLFNFMEEVLGEEATLLFNQVKNGEEAAVFSRFMDAVEGLGDDALNLFDEVLIGAGLTRDTFGGSVLKGMTEMFGDRTLLTPEQFKIFLTNDIVDQATRLAVTKFGVDATGFLVKFAQTVKSAETLGFLRLNPAYPIRNFLNNEFTMLARGTWGGINTTDMLNFWKNLGFEPPRLRSGFGPAEIAEQLAKGDIVPGQQANLIAREIVADAERGTFGWMDKVSNRIKDINLPVDFGKVSAKMESWASVRATTTGFRRYMSKYYNPAKLADYSTETATALAREIGEDGLRRWQQAITSQDTLKGIDALFFADDIALSERAIINLAVEDLGYDIYNILEAEEVATWMPRIIDAAKQGPTRLRDEVSLIKKLVQEKITSGNELMMQDLVAEVASRVETEGLGSLTKVFGDQFDEFWGFNAQHQMDMEKLSNLARGALAGQGPEAAHKSWNAIFEKNALSYGRLWNRLDGRMGAINDGIEAIIKSMDNAGTMTPEIRKALRSFGKENVQNVQQWRKGWENFFKERSDLLNGFFEKQLKGEEFRLAWDQIEETLSESYTKAVDLEDGIWQRIDDAANAIVPEQQRQLHRAWRDAVANIRRADKQSLADFRESIRGLSAAERSQAWDEFRPERLNNIAAIIQEEKSGIAALMGSPEHSARYAAAVAEAEQEISLVERLLRQEPMPVEEKILAKEALERAATPDELKRLREIGLAEEVAVEAPEGVSAAEQAARAATRNEINEAILERMRPAARPLGTDVPSIPDFDTFAPQELFKAIGDDQLWFSRGDEALDALGESARRISADPPIKFETLSPQAQSGLRNYAEAIKGNLSDARYQATRFGEWTRDSALLNYNRRFNYNTWLGVLAPYEFWATQSVFKWALHTIDRPAMLSSYLRMEKFMRTGFRPEPGRPSRLEGNIRIKMPFLPDWMGQDIFIDPLRTFLPFKQFAFPLEQIQRQHEGDIFTTERVLEELFNDGDITREEYSVALTDKEGPIWDRAEYLARQDDAEGRLAPFDFASMLTSPHAPLAWAYNVARGEPERIGPFLPISRSIRGVTALLGIGPNGGVNIEGAIRRELGLPEFDQWDDYRIDRMLSNMAATGEITTEESLRAMIDREGLVFEEAERKAGIEYGIGAMGSTIGMPTKAYPEGEELLREAKDDYERAWGNYEKSGDYNTTLGLFHEQNPGYEARLALWKTPEERLQRFLIDNIWDTWNDFPKLHKDELKEQMGDLFNSAFLSKDTRSYDSIPLETLSTWLRLMGGDPPGKLSPAVPIPPAVLSNPETAQRLQVFYDTRNNSWRYWSAGGPAELQRQYFQLTKEGRKEFARDNPMLTQYWDWRRDFMLRNPDIAPYIEDDPDKRPKFESIEELLAAEAAQPQFTQMELQNLVGFPLHQLIMLGGDLPPIAHTRLDEIAQQVGMTKESIIEQILMQLTTSTVLQ